MRSWRFSSDTWTSSGSCQSSPRRCCQSSPRALVQLAAAGASGVTGGEPAALGVRLDHPWGARTARGSGGALWCDAGWVWAVWARKLLWGRSRLWELLNLKIPRWHHTQFIQLLSFACSFCQTPWEVGLWSSHVNAPMESVRIGPSLVITSLGTRGYEMDLAWKVDRPEGFS